MSAHRRSTPSRTKLRRTLTAAVVAAASGLGMLVGASPASAAGPWFVSPLGLNTNNCLTSGTACATVTGVLAKAGFVSGDIINVAAGTYLDRPLFQTKTADVRGAGASTIFNGSNTSWGIGVAIGNGATLRLSNLRITNGRTATGAGLPIASGQVIATDVTINNNNATTNANSVGGGAYVAAGSSLTMINGSISNNTASSGGGAAYVVAGGTLSLNGTTVGTNSAPVAGGIFNLGTTTTNGGTFSSNSSPFGGAIATAGSATLSGTAFTSNTSSNQGGAVFNNTGTLTINGGSSFSGNTAALGGAVYQQAGTTTMSQSASLSNNVATNNGGAVYQAAGSMNLGNALLAGNAATNQGGGVYSAAGSVSTNGASFQVNSANVLGGAITIVTGTASITGGAIANNTSLNGGGLYNGGTTTIDGTSLTANTGNGGSATNGGNAGAIYNSAALTVKNATFAANKVVMNTNATPGITGYGGAIGSFSLSAAGAPTINITNTTINGDSGGTPVPGGNANIGGAIVALGNIGAGGAATVLTADGLTLSKNVAAAAGGIYASGPVTLTNSTVTQNKATHASAGIGGGIYTLPQAASSTLTLDNTDVTGNDGTAGGGGIVTTMNAVIKNGSTVNNNTGAIGAGIYTAAASTSVTGSEVKGNNASNSGGGIYTAGPVTITDSAVDNNTAAFLGGGLSTSETAGGFTMTGGTLSGNNAFAAGGVFIGNSLLASFDDTDMIGNTSTGANFGGGALLSAGQVTINKAQILDNTADGATGLGGALFSGSSDENVTTSLKVTNSTLAGNEANQGSAIWAGSSKASSTNKTSLSNTTVTGNASQSAAGAIVTYDPISVTGSTITDNTATGGANAYGGIVAAANGLVSLSGSILSGNSGHQCATTVNDGGNNLLSPTDAGCGLAASGKGNVFAAPQLGALASNGGPTQTLLPGPTSPALDRISASSATGVNDAITGNAVTLCGSGASDQRGTARPQGAKCDIGAVEADQIAPTISGPSSVTYTVGVAGAPQNFTTTGSPQPTLSATGLPNGVTFTDNGNGTGTLAGTPGPNTGGVHTITITATNEAGSAPKTFTLTINQSPALAGPTAATYTVGQPGGPTTFTSTGHPTSTLSSTGGLPSGVAFTDNGDGTGAYAGTPGAGTGGVYGTTVTASNGTPPDATAPFTLTVNEAAGITGPSADTFKVGTVSSGGEYVGTGYPLPTLSATGLPSGLALGSTGPGKAKVSGNAANGTGGVHPITVTATNGVGGPASQATTVTVNEAPELVGPTEARWVTGTANTIGFSSDGFPQATLTYTGTLPAGLSFTDNGNGSATISGTAPANAVGNYTVTVKASNGQSPDATKTVVIEVVPPLSISTTSLPNAAYKTAYSAQVTASGGQPAYSFEIVSGSLPPGLSMNSFGLITGSAQAATGTYTFTVKATDSLDPAQTATKQLSITLVKGNTHMDVTAIVSGVQPNGDLSINVGLVEADIKGGFPLVPVAGVSVKFTSGTKTVCTAISDANGHAQCSQNPLDALLTPLKGSLTATFAGNTLWNGSAATAGAFQPGSSGGSGGGSNPLAWLFGG